MSGLSASPDISPPVLSLIERTLVWDNHACMPLNQARAHQMLPQLSRYASSGVDVLSLNVGYDGEEWRNTSSLLAQFRDWVKRHPRKFMLVHTTSDIQVAKSTGRLGICFDIEGGRALNDNAGMVEAYYDLGVRWMSIAYNRNNALGGGCQDDDDGLTDFGKQVIDEMQRVGMVVCCSHTGFRTTMDVMERAANPVIFSHSNPLSICSHKRNVTDEAIKACAQTGGVVGINGIGFFLGQNDASTNSIVRHIDYVAQLVGADHVGLGLDYVFDEDELQQDLEDRPELYPRELGYFAGVNLVRPEQIPEIAEALSRLGYRERDLTNILGGNHLRIANQVWS